MMFKAEVAEAMELLRNIDASLTRIAGYAAAPPLAQLIHLQHEAIDHQLATLFNLAAKVGVPTLTTAPTAGGGCDHEWVAFEATSAFSAGSACKHCKAMMWVAE